MVSRLATQTLPVMPEAEEQQRISTAPSDLLPLLYRQMRALVGPRPGLDDLVQAAAERALKSLPNFDGRSALSTWTYSIAYRTLVDHQRWYHRWTRHFSFAEDHGSDEPPSSMLNTEAACRERARAKRLYAALNELPPAKRAVIVLHDLEELPLKEVATIVDTNERTVRSRLRDGRKKLAVVLEADPLFEARGGDQ